MRKRKYREVKQFTQSHTAGTWWNWYYQPDSGVFGWGRGAVILAENSAAPHWPADRSRRPVSWRPQGSWAGAANPASLTGVGGKGSPAAPSQGGRQRLMEGGK